MCIYVYPCWVRSVLVPRCHGGVSWFLGGMGRSVLIPRWRGEECPGPQVVWGGVSWSLGGMGRSVLVPRWHGEECPDMVPAWGMGCVVHVGHVAHVYIYTFMLWSTCTCRYCNGVFPPPTPSPPLSPHPPLLRYTQSSQNTKKLAEYIDVSLPCSLISITWCTHHCTCGSFLQPPPPPPPPKKKRKVNKL